MKIENPVIRGFYPDPSVCKANGKYYLVNSTFQFFPGIPIFESDDLINWKQIGHCLTRKSQLDLTNERPSGGIYAPTIRFNNGRFYVVVTNVNGMGNFFVYTDDIYGEWSDPVKVERGGIDPSLYFEGDRTYFLSNGEDNFGINGISCCEIDIETGKQLTKAKCISTGCGGRWVEGPHLYKINNWYYLLIAEGGTEYGHMECILRSKEVYGPYEKCPDNPILTNRNLGGYMIQGSGHADIVEGTDGQWWMVHLAFRQIGIYPQFHHLGRETFLEPIFWTEDGWLKVGADGTARMAYEVDDNKYKILPDPKYPVYKWKFNTQNACFIRLPDMTKYHFLGKGNIHECTLFGTENKLNSRDNVTFTGMRQTEFFGSMEVSIDVDQMVDGQIAGISAYMDELNHYDVRITKQKTCFKASGIFFIGGKKFCDNEVEYNWLKTILRIEFTNEKYLLLLVDENNKKILLGEGQSKYLSSEVAEGFTGVILGMFVESNSEGKSGGVTFKWN